MSATFLAAAAARTADVDAVEAVPPPAPTVLPDGLLVEHRAGRGRSLILTRAVGAGETILAEAPVCWWVDAERHEDVCARCLCVIPLGGAYGCDVCKQACYCSKACRDEDADRHASVCRILCAAAVDKSLPGWGASSLGTNLMHFVAHALALSRSDPPAFARLWGLQLDGVALDAEERVAVHRIASQLEASVGGKPPRESSWRLFVEHLCMKDKASNMALTMPPADESDD